MEHPRASFATSKVIIPWTDVGEGDEQIRPFYGNNDLSCSACTEFDELGFCFGWRENKTPVLQMETTTVIGWNKFPSSERFSTRRKRHLRRCGLVSRYNLVSHQKIQSKYLTSAIVFADVKGRCIESSIVTSHCSLSSPSPIGARS